MANDSILPNSDDLMNAYYDDTAYYPDDMQDALEAWEDMIMHESGFHPLMFS